MKKKTVAAFLALALVWSVSACGVSGAAEAEDAPEAAETGETTEDTAETGEASEEQTLPEGFGDRLVSVDNVDKYIKLAEYKGISLEKPEIEVTDEQVEDEIGYRLSATMEEVTDADAQAQPGDTVTINFVGTKDGIAFEGGTAENYDLTLGQGGMIDGFEDGIVGMKKGETKDLNLTFPENYYEESLAGEDVIFQITVQKIQRAPELSDEWAAANSEAKTAEEYRELIRQELLDNAEEEAQYGLQISAWNTVYTDSEVVEYPEADIQNAKDGFEYQIMLYAGDTDMSLEEFLDSQGYSMDDYNEQSQQYAENKVKQNLIVQGIMDAEGLTLDDEASQTIKDNVVSDYGASDISELMDIYGQTAVNEAICFLRVEQFLVDNAAITFEVVDADAEMEDIDEEELVEEDEESEDGELIEEDEAADTEEEAE